MPRYKSERAESQIIQIMEAIASLDQAHEAAIRDATKITTPVLGNHFWKLLKNGMVYRDYYTIRRKDDKDGKAVCILRLTLKGIRYLKRNKPTEETKADAPISTEDVYNRARARMTPEQQVRLDELRKQHPPGGKSE